MMGVSTVLLEEAQSLIHPLLLHPSCFGDKGGQLVLTEMFSD
jgi:hypothetical protein